jgi:hypothetical protein
MAAAALSRWVRRTLTRPVRRFTRGLELPTRLEDRVAPAIFTATIDPAINNAGAVTELIGFVNQANTSNEPDTIVLWPNAKYTFEAAIDANEGANALPSIVQDGAGKNPVTFQGNGATFFRDAADTDKFRFLRVTGTNANLIVQDLTFTGGFAGGTSAAGSGGAILASSNAILTVSDSTFIGNTSAADGGGVAVLNGAGGSTSSFTRTIFNGNTAGGTGGAAIATSFGFSSFVDSQIVNNTSTGGAGGVAGNGFIVFDFTRVTFTGNVGTSAGAFQGAEASFTYGSVIGNTANSGGTGGLDAVLANIYVGYSTIADNIGKSTVSSGGGIQGNKVVVVNSTIHNNESGNGGGISGRDISVLYSTVTNNKATFGIASPGGIQGTFSTTKITLSHTVVAGNVSTAGATEIADISATDVISNGFNFIGIKPAATTLLASDQFGTLGSPANPQLGALKNNGGMTLTRAPLAGSPLINTGKATLVAPVTLDQRGYARIVGAKADIGAFEVQAGNAVGIVVGNLQSTKVTTAFANNLQAIVTDPNGGLVSGAKVTFVGPSFGAGPEFSGKGTAGSAMTNASGIASIPIQANTLAGVYNVNASVGGLAPVAYTLRNTNFVLSPPPSFGVVAGSTGSGQTEPVTGFYDQPLTISLTSNGIPVAGYPVTFLAPATGAGVTFPNGGITFTTLTDATGKASAIVQANTKSGSVTVTAEASGYGIATYTLTNLAGDAAAINVVSGSGQTAFLTTAFAFPLIAQVLDTFGNPSPGQTVTFTPPGAGASANFPNSKAVSDANGIVTSSIPTANDQGGTFNVTASALLATAQFKLTNFAPPPPPPPANTPPVISGIANQTTTTGVAVGPITFVVVDLETAPTSLVVTGSSNNPALIPNSGIVLGGTGSNRTVTVVPLAGQTGIATITLTVTDGGSLTAFTTFTVTVNAPVLTPPTITPIGNQTVVTGGTAGPLGFVIGDAETPLANLTVTAVADNTTLFPTGTIVLAGSGANRTVTLTPALGQTGSSVITVTVTDGDAMTAQSVFTVTVTPPPATPPSISDLADVTVTLNTTGGPYAFIVTDALTPANNLTVSAKSSNTTLLSDANIVLGGTGNFRNVTVTPATGQSGTAVVTITVTNAAGLTASDTFTVTVPSIIPLPPSTGFVAGTAAGLPALVRATTVDGKERLLIQPFDPAYSGGARVSQGDFNSDGTLDIAVGTGPGSVSLVRIFDGKTGSVLRTIRPFEESFTGGIFVAAGDINGDGKADLVVTPDVGGSSRTIIYNNGKENEIISNFFGIDDPLFRGGARCAVGDINNDGKADVVIAAGFGGGPRIAGFSGATMGTNGGTRLFNDFFAFADTLNNGTYVAVGDLNADGFGDLIAGAGPGGGPRVTAFNGQSLVTTGTVNSIANFFAFPDSVRTGVRVAAVNLNGDNRIDIVAGTGGGRALVRGFAGSDTLIGNPAAIFEYEPFVGSTTGVFVG